MNRIFVGPIIMILLAIATPIGIMLEIPGNVLIPAWLVVVGIGAFIQIPTFITAHRRCQEMDHELQEEIRLINTLLECALLQYVEVHNFNVGLLKRRRMH